MQWLSILEVRIWAVRDVAKWTGHGFGCPLKGISVIVEAVGLTYLKQTTKPSWDVSLGCGKAP